MLDGVAQMNDEMHLFLVKQKTLDRLPRAFVTHQPLSAYEARGYLDSLDAHRDALSASDRWRLDRLRGAAPRPGARWAQRAAGVLYRNGQDLFSVREEGEYALQANPLFYGQIGPVRGSATDNDLAWRNTRGVRLSGSIDIGPKVFFEGRLEENQERPFVFQGQALRGVRTAPRQGQVNLNRDEVYDYLRATGVVGVHSNYFEVRFGHDTNRWGYGPNSMFLSNFSTAYDHLQLRTTVGRVQYTNLFARFVNATAGRDDLTDVFPNRYGAFHRLVIEVSDRVQIEAFEQVLFGPDSVGVRGDGFELSYLNPVIFYRAVERDLGSPDNVLLGVGGSWIATPGLRLYGQFLLDELRVQDIGTESWANKWGWMVGTHAVLPGALRNLEARVEVARLRPYLYAHRTSTTAVINYADPLGHVAGANAYDVLASLDYRPAGRLQTALTVAYTLQGRNARDADGTLVNWGADPTVTYQTRPRNLNLPMLVGPNQATLRVEAQVSVEVLPNLYATGALYARQVDDEVNGLTRYVAPVAALRWGLPFQSLRY